MHRGDKEFLLDILEAIRRIRGVDGLGACFFVFFFFYLFNHTQYPINYTLFIFIPSTKHYA